MTKDANEIKYYSVIESELTLSNGKRLLLACEPTLGVDSRLRDLVTQSLKVEEIRVVTLINGCVVTLSAGLLASAMLVQTWLEGAASEFDEVHNYTDDSEIVRKIRSVELKNASASARR